MDRFVEKIVVWGSLGVVTKGVCPGGVFVRRNEASR